MRKSYKFIIYISFVFMFSFSISSINVKAYQGVNNVEYTINSSNDKLGLGSYTAKFPLSNNNSRGIFIKGSLLDIDFNSMFNSNADRTFSDYLVFVYDSRYENFTSPTRVSTSGYWDQSANIYKWFVLNNEDNNVTNTNLQGICICSYNIISRFSNGKVDSTTVGNLGVGDCQYVNSVSDLLKFFNGDNTVIKNGDPLNPPVTQDNTLPVPQSLTCDIHNKYTGSNPYLVGGWSNPANASFDAIKDSVKIHIQYKPRFQYYKRFISVKDEVVSAREWINLGTVENNNKNKWINCFTNTPQTENNIIKFETLQTDMQTIATANNLYAGGATIDNGSSWRVRYEMPDGRVSYWAVYNIKAIGKVSYADDVTFQDNENNVVSSDAVSYQNSNQTDPENQDRDNSLLGRLKIALNNMQSLPKDMQNVADEGSSFANFLKKVWEKFPEIYIIFIGGLIIAIILRILGR